MAAPRKFDPESRERAVRMYEDRIAQTGDSKLAARRYVGELLGINQETLRNWVDNRYGTMGATPGAAPDDRDAELSSLRKEVPTCEEPTRVSRRQPAFFAAAEVDHRDRFGVDPVCSVLTEHGLPIAPSTYYAAKARGPVSDAAWAEAHAANTVHRLYVANRRPYGVRKMWRAMKHAGHGVGRDRVARLMRICGIQGIVRGKRRTVITTADPGAPRHPDLIDRRWDCPNRPDQWWVADFAYVWTVQGFVYTAFCVDVFSRRIPGGG